MTEKIKVLYFVDRMLRGGIQSLCIDIVRNIDKNKFEIDFLLLDDGKEYELENELVKLGCKVYKLKNIWINKWYDYIKYNYKLKEFFEDIGKNYDIIHLHSSSKNFLVLYWAKKNGIKVRIAHSHNTDFQTNNKLKKIIGNLFKKMLKRNATDFMACSELAGKWLFGNKTKFMVFRNAIDITKFDYDANKRKKIRKLYNISEDDIVCGNVGRLVEQKNHKFLIEIFKEICLKNPHYKLLIVGKGDNEIQSELENMINEYKIKNNVIFAGFQKESFEYFNAMDLFLFPSKFEGLGIVLIEAQANGLVSIVSEGIPNEAKITEDVKTISLSNREQWINEILECNKERKKNMQLIIDAGYCMHDEIKKLENYYMKRVEDEKIKKM